VGASGRGVPTCGDPPGRPSERRKSAGGTPALVPGIARPAHPKAPGVRYRRPSSREISAQVLVVATAERIRRVPPVGCGLTVPQLPVEGSLGSSPVTRCTTGDPSSWFGLCGSAEPRFASSSPRSVGTQAGRRPLPDPRLGQRLAHRSGAILAVGSGRSRLTSP
jgi:hypothetical protein